MSDLFKDVPEFVEVGRSEPVSQLVTYVQVDLGESVAARTETLRTTLV